VSFVRKSLAILLTALWLAPSIPAEALDPERRPAQYGHDVWQTDQGLPQNSVVAIEQTQDGYLWLGTYQGLVRFDGTRFVVFHSGNTEAITSNRIVALAEDGHGGLWIGTNGGGLVRYQNGRFTAFHTGSGLPSDAVSALLVARDGAVWIGTRDAGLSRFAQGRFQNFTPADGLSNKGVTSLCQTRDGSIWIGTEGGLDQYASGVFRAYTTKQGLPRNDVWAIHEDSEGALWIGTFGGGLSRFDGQRFTNFSTRDGLSNDTVFAVLEDRDRNLWIGTNGGGLVRYSNGRFERYGSAEGLSDDFVYALDQDREGNLWVGTFSGGLNRLKNVAVSMMTTREGLRRDFLYSTLQDRKGTIWLGAVQGTLMRMDGDRVSSIALPRKMADFDVWSLSEAAGGHLLVGTDGGGVLVFDGEKFSYPAWNASLSNQIVWAINRTRDGSLWLGTAGGGVNHVRPDGAVETIGTSRGLPNLFVRAIHHDRRGRMWFGTDGGGVAILDKGRLTTLSMSDGLSSNFIRCLYEDANGLMWVGTYGGGLNRIEDGKVTRYSTETGLFDDVVVQIVEEGGYLWMSGNRGIFRVSLQELNELARGDRVAVSSIAYGRADGMRTLECSDGSPGGIRTRDGRLLFATGKGLAVIHPSRIPRNLVPPPILVDSVMAEGRPVRPGERVDARRGRGRFEFHYVSLSLVAPEKVRYRHRLAGFERDWVDAGSARVASYTNLPPGAYRFEVQAQNNDGVWSQKAAAFEFARAPRFFETYTFYGFTLACVALAGTGGHLWRVRRARQRELALMAIVDERTKQLEDANARLRELSFVDPLTGVANRRRFDEHLSLEWRRAIRSESSLAVVMIDLDSFKRFNDAHGHQEGDRALQRVASVLTDAAQRAGDLVARYGGEEFVLLLQGTDETGALTLAERVRADVEALAIPHIQSRIGSVVTISVGVTSVIPTEDLEPAAVIAAADAALYRAKAEGGNRVAQDTAVAVAK
jgi:diguanylate cyclase (GGDEF)-like protein